MSFKMLQWIYCMDMLVNMHLSNEYLKCFVWPNCEQNRKVTVHFVTKVKSWDFLATIYKIQKLVYLVKKLILRFSVHRLSLVYLCIY